MREYELGQLLVNDLLPEDMRDYNRVISKKSLGKLMTELAKKHPDQYKEVSHRLLQLGYNTAYLTNGDSFTLADMAPTKISKQMQKELNSEVQKILYKARKDGIKTNDPKITKAILNACIEWSKKSDEGTESESDFDTNALYRQALKTGVGAQKPGTYKSIRTGDVLYVDQNNKPVPIPVTRSYAQGLRPAEYFAGAFGTRKGIVDLQKATQDAGYLCLSGEELVRMADFSVKKIKDIVEGDYVLGVDDNRIAKPVKVTHLFDNGIRECYRTTFRVGTDKHSTISFVSTKEHKLSCEVVKQYREKKDNKVIHKYTYIQDVLPVGTPGDLRALPVNGVYDFDGIHDNYAFLIGLLLGDGSITNTKNNRDISLACFDTELIDYLKDGYLDSIDLKIDLKNIKLGQYTIRDKVRHTENIVVNKNKFASALNSNLKIKLQELGLLGTYSDTKFIPDIVYKWDKESIAKLIAGYFVTDGSIYTQRGCTQIKFASVSKRLVEQLKELLETRFGILCNSIGESNSNKNRNSTNKTAYYLGIYRAEDVLKFCKEIPAVGVKTKRVNDFIVNYSKPTKNTRKYYRVSQDYVGELHTYDIEVDSPNHLFVLANGLIVSNSKQLVQIAHRLVVDSNEDPTQYDEKNPLGYPTDVDDADNEGALLSMPVGGYKRNTILTPKILADLKQKGIKNILVRSVIAGGPANGGIYAYDAGIRENGGLPAQGDFVGINAVQSISEPITQAAISCLHPKTKVRMADNSVKNIEDIVVGDMVLGANKDGYTNPVKVLNVFHNGIQPVYHTAYTNGTDTITINATLEHKVLNYINDNYIMNNIGDSDNIVIVNNKDKVVYDKVNSEFIDNIDTIDIEVDNEDHLFVLANGMVVSNSKHSGGVAGADSGKAISGFKYINQLIQVPKHFQGGATHSTIDGVVEKIRPAAQGGYYITVAGKDHYVRTDQGDETPILVKVGDEVEAGDVMSDGIPNPAMVVKYKGLGEGRRYFTNMFREALDRAGTPVNRRNIEALSRGLISYVKLNSEVGDYSPDDILPYTMVAADYQPRDGYTVNTPKSCRGMYLEKPVLHYTIGTRITPTVIKTLNDYNINAVTCHKDPPPFEPEMVRGMAHAANDPDWGTKMLGSYNKESLLESTRLGAVSNTAGTSYVPALAFGKTDFGNSGALKQGGYDLLKTFAKFYKIIK